MLLPSETASARAPPEDQLLGGPVDERVVSLEPIVADEHVVLPSQIDDGELDVFAVESSVGVPQLHLQVDGLFDVTVERPVGVVDGSLVGDGVGSELQAPDEAGVDAGLGASAVEQCSDWEPLARVLRDEDGCEVELEFGGCLDSGLPQFQDLTRLTQLRYIGNPVIPRRVRDTRRGL